MAYVRFPIPAFNAKEFKNMAWSAPSFLKDAEIADLMKRQKAGDASSYGVYAVKPSDAFFDAHKIKGDNRHAVMCVLPSKKVKVLGRSHAWYIQRAIVLDGMDAGSKTVLDWKTTRPICTRLGPDDGTTIDGGVYYALCCRQYADYWLGNRTILDNEWKKGSGCRILSASVDDIDDFHEVYLEFQW